MDAKVIKMHQEMLQSRVKIENVDFDHVQFAFDKIFPFEPSMTKFKLVVWIMVFNEESYIEKTLATAVGIADCIVIGDTGSTDNTIQKCIDVCAKEQMPLRIIQIKDPIYPVPFEWFNYSAFRNRIKEFAEMFGDYVLQLDASDEIQGGQNLIKIIDDKKNENVASFVVSLNWNGYIHGFPRLTKSSFALRFKDARHNYLDIRDTIEKDITNSGFCLYQDRSKAKSSLQKYSKDADYFKWRIDHQLDNDRVWFYYAQSLSDSDQFQKAYDAYKKCSLRTNQWYEQLLMSHYCCWKLAQKLQFSIETQKRHLLDAMNVLPTYFVAVEIYRICFTERKYGEAHAWILAACSIGCNALSLHDDVYMKQEKRWALLGSSSLQCNDMKNAIIGYLNAQRGHLEMRSALEEFNELENDITCYGSELGMLFQQCVLQNREELRLFKNVDPLFIPHAMRNDFLEKMKTL